MSYPLDIWHAGFLVSHARTAEEPTRPLGSQSPGDPQETATERAEPTA